MFGAPSLYALGQIELIAGYVVLAAILLSINLWARIRWSIKFAAIVITCAFFFITFVSIEQLLGWPTDRNLPDRFEFLYAVVIEPDQARRETGAIYIWALTLPGAATDAGSHDPHYVRGPETIDSHIAPRKAPRAYRLPYSRAMHKMIHQARERVIEGVRQIGETGRPPAKPGEQSPQTEFHFFDRPSPILPPKGPPPSGG